MCASNIAGSLPIVQTFRVRVRASSPCPNWPIKLNDIKSVSVSGGQTDRHTHVCAEVNANCGEQITHNQWVNSVAAAASAAIT